VIDRLAEHYRVVVPSLRYHYPNEWVGDGLDYTPETHAKDVTGLIKALGLAPAHIARSSMGADIGLVLARDYADLLRMLILGEPGLSNWLLEIETAEDREANRSAWEIIQQAVIKGDYENAVRLFADQVIGLGAFERLPEATRRRMMDNVRLLALPEEIRNDTQSTFSREDARSITVPTLLLRGDSSPKQFLLADEELAKNLPGAKRGLIPNAAHVLHSMNPQVYSDAVLSFISRH
jgi:non-heme chloroperoxidase